MLFHQSTAKIQIPQEEQEWILKKADRLLKEPIPHITDVTSPTAPGSIHDYYSNGDYWWPNPNTFDGLPYIRRDGESNPNNFNFHRILLRHMRTNVDFLSAAYSLTKEERFAAQAVQILKEFF